MIVLNGPWRLKQVLNKASSNSINSYILFFTEFLSYFGAGILIIQYISPDKKENNYTATHYIEVNKYGEGFQSIMYVKLFLNIFFLLRISLYLVKLNLLLLNMVFPTIKMILIKE